MILACIDLGTNTFHLLIAAYENGVFKEVFRQRCYIYLAKTGINKIGEDALSRAIKAIDVFSAKLTEYKPKKVEIVGTAALRTAANGNIITDYILENLGLKVDIIDGQREAELIYKGTALVYYFRPTQTALIMDIGGGSVEFILVQNSINIWKYSFKVGISILKQNFHKSDPINTASVDELFNYLSENLTQLNKQIANQKIDVLIGCSGTFEVLQQLSLGEIIMDRCTNHSSSMALKIWDDIKFLNKEQRIDYGIPATRSEYIIVALGLIKYIIDEASIKQISVSPYALKEGLLAEMAHNLD